MALATDTVDRGGMGGRLVTRLRNLRVNRIAFVSEGDDPLARVAIWKAKEDPPAPARRTLAELLAGTRGAVDQRTEDERVTEVVQGAFDALRRRNDEQEVVEMELRKSLDALERGSGRVSKAADLAARLRALVEQDLDRVPFDRRGERRSVEQGLASVSRSREGGRLLKAVRQEGRSGDVEFRKAFDHVAPEPTEPTATAAETSLLEMARSVAVAKGISRESALREVVDTPEGRELQRAHRAEAAAR